MNYRTIFQRLTGRNRKDNCVTPKSQKFFCKMEGLRRREGRIQKLCLASTRTEARAAS